MNAEPSSGGTFIKEPVNAITHAVGALMAVAVTIYLVSVSAGDLRASLSLAAFGVGSLLLFTASTVMHAVRGTPTQERWLRRADHAAIFVLIAASYTPVALIALRGTHERLGWWLFGAAWGVALLGLAFKVAWIGAPRWLSTGLYLGMGWLLVIALGPVIRGLGASGTLWLFLGGLFYTVGAVVYGTKRPNPWPGVFGFHELWHLFVLAGWACHVVMMIGLASAA